MGGRVGGTVNVGDLVDDFELKDEQGVPRKLSELLATGPVVLFFFPAAMTAGCTVEACHFRDISTEFARPGCPARRHQRGLSGAPGRVRGEALIRIPTPVRSGRSRAEQFGAKRGSGLGSTRRVTFVIGPDRRVIDVVRSEIRMNADAQGPRGATGVA